MVVPNLKDLELTNLGHVYSDWTNVYGVSPNFFDVMLPGFLVVNEMDTESPYPLTEQLYTPLGSASAFVGSLYKDKFAFNDLNAQFLVEASCTLARLATGHSLLTSSPFSCLFSSSSSPSLLNALVLFLL